jgi:transposase
MIVLGADTHKSSHTIAAVDTSTGQVLGDKTVTVGARGYAALGIWARGLDRERVWAREDCRHVSGALERFLIARGERVVRVSTRLMAGTRRSSRKRGKSDQIDAVSVARASLAAGIETLPTAALAGPELDLRLLVDHRERLVRTRHACPLRPRDPERHHPQEDRRQDPTRRHPLPQAPPRPPHLAPAPAAPADTDLSQSLD